ncbi:AzlC family ABC transporter permease [Xanthobacter sp. TB0139]|uniref:AzlC family ABC transporter permease n=1 Tax=Xanthobacter sp. TB0139 TaxID=3459178 RepID=UPI00403924F8
MRHGIGMPGLVLFASYLGYGALLQGISFPLGAGMLSTFLVWALPAQVILVGGLSAGTALPALALAVTLSSIRFLPMVVSIAPYMRGPKRSLLLELICAHYVALTLWAEGLRLLPHMPGQARVPFTLGLGNMLVTLSICATAVGYYMAGEVPLPVAAALLFITPLFFTLVMVRGAARAMDWMTLAAGAGLTPLVQHLDGGLDLMVAGIGGGTLAYFISRSLRRRSRA